jgi:hypothetical protein
MMVAIMGIVNVKWRWRLGTFNGIAMLIIALGVALSICSCATRVVQMSGSTSLVLEILRTFRHQSYGELDVAAAFLPHQGQPLAKGLIVVTTLVTNVAFILWHFGHSQDWWQSMSMQFVTLASKYCHFL